MRDRKHFKKERAFCNKTKALWKVALCVYIFVFQMKPKRFPLVSAFESNFVKIKKKPLYHLEQIDQIITNINFIYKKEECNVIY